MATNRKPYHHKKNFNPAVKVMKYAGMDEHIIQMFAAFVIALKSNTEISDEDITYLLGKTQEEWNKSVEMGYNIADKCAMEYDFDVRRAN